MITSNILILALGLFTYWVVKFIGVKKADNPVFIKVVLIDLE